MSHPSKRESLLTQLENMHKQFSDETTRKLNENGNPVEPASNRRNQPLISSVLGRNERTNSMPMFAGSSSHNGLLTSNNNQDMSFVMGLSENLLVECRRLQADNDKKARKYKTVRQNYDELKETNQKLESAHQLAAKELQSLRDLNWGLEEKLQNLSTEFKTQKEKLNRSKRDFKQETESTKKLKADLEVANSQHANLENQLECSKKQLAADVADLKRHVSDLNDENDALHSNNHQLKDQIDEYEELDVKRSNQHKALQKEVEHARHTIRKLKRQTVRSVTKKQERLGAGSSNGSQRANAEEQENVSSDGEPNDSLDNTEGDAEVDDMNDEILLADVQDFAKRHNMVLLSKEIYEKIPPALLESSASKERTNETTNKTQRESTTSDEKEQPQSSIDFLKSCGYEIFSAADYEKMQDTIHAHDYPSLGYLESKLQELGKRAITLENYESLSSPTHSQLIEKLEREKFKVLCLADYQKLRNSLERPTLEELNDKLQLHNHVAIPQEEYRGYVIPNLASVEANAKSLGYTVIKEDLYSDMETALQNPSTQIIKTSLGKNDSIADELLTWIIEKRDAKILLDKTRFEQLEACYEDPTREFLQEKAALQGSELINSSEYAEIKHKLSNPSFKYLEDKAAAIECKVLASKELAQLVNTSEDPTLDFLARKAENKGYCVIQVKEYQCLTSIKQNPDVEFLTAKAKEKHFELVEEETYRSLIKNKSDPDLAFLKEKGSLKGYELVEKSRFEQMLAKLSNPGKKELDSMAKTLGYVNLSIPELERMKGLIEHPSIEFLSSQAKKINLLLIGEDEKKRLEETGKDKASVFSAVKAFGFVPVPVPDLNLLKKSTIDNVGLPEIKTRLCSLGYIAMPAGQIEKPIAERASRDDTIALCSKYNLKPIPFAEYEQLKNDDKIKPHSKDECAALLKSLNYVVLPEKTHEELTSQLESPGLNYLKERCSDLNHTVIPSDEYQEILQNVEKPSFDYLREKAVISGFSLVHTKRLEELQGTFDSPPLEFIEQKAKLHGRLLITFKEKNLKDKQLEHPTLSYLSTKAIEVGKCLVDQEFFDDLRRKVTTPTRKELEVACDVLGVTLVPKDEYSRLNEKANSPTLSNLKTHLDKIGYYCLPRNEYDALQEHFNCPTEEFLVKKSHSLGKVLVDEVTYGEQRCQIENPSREYLVEHAENIHMELVNAAEYNKILELANSPSREHLEKKASNLGFMVVSQKEFESVKNEAENPALSKMEKILQALGFVLIESSKYRTLVEEAESPSVEKISQLAAKHDHILVNGKNVIQEESNATDLTSIVKSGSYVLLKKDAYDSLMDASMKKMSKREVIDICANLDMIALPRDEYDHLSQTPDLEAIQALAAQHASLVVLREQFDLLSAEADCPSTEAMDKSAEQKGLIIVQKAEYASLLSKVNSPSKRDLERQAEKLDLVAVPSGKYKSLLKEVQNKSASSTPSPSSKVLASKQYFEQVIRDQAENPDKSYEPTKTLGFVKLSSEEYKTLKDNQQAHVLTKADIYNGAKVFSLAVLPLEEYKELLKKKVNCNSLNYENLEDYAAKFDLKLVPLGLCNLDSPTPRRRKSNGSNRGDFLGFDDQSSHVTMRSCSTRETDYIDANSNPDSSRLLQRQLTVSTTNSSNFTDALDDNMEECDSDAASLASTVRAVSANEKDSLEDIRAKASELGYRLIALANSEEDLEQREIPENKTNTNLCRSESENGESVMSEEKLRCQAGKIGLVVMSKSEFENLQPTRENVEAIGAELNLVILEKREYDELIERGDVDVTRINELAAHYGLKVLPYDQVEQLEKERLTKENLIAKAQEIGYVALTSKRIEELEAKADAKEAPMTREVIEQKAASFGLTLVPIRDDRMEGTQRLSVGKDSKEVLIARAHEFNLILLEHDEYQRLCEHKKSEDADQQRKSLSDFSLNDVVELASTFGLVPIEKKQFEEIKSELSHPTLTKEELIELAPEHSMVCISRVEYDHIKALPKNKIATKEAEGSKVSEVKSHNSGSTSKNALTELHAIAKEHGLFRGPKDVSPSVLGSKSNESNKFVVLPGYYYDDLLNENKMLDLKVKRVENRSSDVKVSPRAPLARDKSSQGLPQPPLIGSPKVNRQTSRSSLRTIAAGAKKNLVEASAANAHEEFVKVPKAMSHGSISGVKHSRNPSIVTRNDSMVSSIGRTGSMGAISLATVASLSEPSIIPALTQTVIGEYLYKYYPYLGQFGMNSRHERFFWVHPYTLTLYWSTSNPIMANPSNHKTKCAAILAVDSIVDTNPYPAGLYHKSIIITSEKKTIKITCPTRQRHNIWYNSLRYLIQRNMEGINLEDIADDPSDTMYSGKIFPLPGENSKSTSQRLSSSRKSMKKLPKSASVPLKRR